VADDRAAFRTISRRARETGQLPPIPANQLLGPRASRAQNRNNNGVFENTMKSLRRAGVSASHCA
jgi:hypothetical protein